MQKAVSMDVMTAQLMIRIDTSRHPAQLPPGSCWASMVSNYSAVMTVAMMMAVMTTASSYSAVMTMASSYSAVMTTASSYSAVMTMADWMAD